MPRTRPRLPNPADPPTFSAREQQLAALLAAGWKIGKACDEVGVSERQGLTWRKKPGFDAMTNTIRADMYMESLGRLASLTTRAVDVLEKVLEADGTPPAVLVSAARGVLADAISLRASVETERRIAELEGRLPRAKS